jgi:hypothetical protein
MTTEITLAMLEDLQRSICSTIPDHDPQGVIQSIQEHSTDEFGSIWHGDFYSKPDSGSFGSAAKPLHYGMINNRQRETAIHPVKSFAPITSSKTKGRKVLTLPPGIIRTRSPKTSYILLSYKLLVRKSFLRRDFEYIQRLPEEYIHKAERMITDAI